MDRHATWRHKIIRPSVARPIFDHMRWHTKSKPNKKSQDRKGTLAQARPPARPNHKITRVPFRTLGDLISTSELYREAENSTGRKKNRKNRRPTAGNTTGEPMAHGPWPMAQGPWPKAHGPWPMAQGPRPKAHGPWPMAHGPWPMAHGPWPMAQGPWPMVHGPWPRNTFCFQYFGMNEHPIAAMEL